jgi:small subunit ribosomal protein S6
VSESIRARGGTVERVDRWGRRNFAYELKHRSEGFYVFFEVDSDPPAMAEIERMLSLADEVLRHRVIRLPEKYAARIRGTRTGSAS